MAGQSHAADRRQSIRSFYAPKRLIRDQRYANEAHTHTHQIKETNGVSFLNATTRHVPVFFLGSFNLIRFRCLFFFATKRSRGLLLFVSCSVAVVTNGNGLLPSFTELLPSFDWVFLGLTGFHWVLLGFY